MGHAELICRNFQGLFHLIQSYNMVKSIKLASLPDYVAHLQLCPLINALREKKKIVVIAGAGISDEAGSK
jgi:hypothetical protein